MGDMPLSPRPTYHVTEAAQLARAAPAFTFLDAGTRILCVGSCHGNAAIGVQDDAGEPLCEHCAADAGVDLTDWCAARGLCTAHLRATPCGYCQEDAVEAIEAFATACGDGSVTFDISGEWHSGPSPTLRERIHGPALYEHQQAERAAEIDRACESLKGFVLDDECPRCDGTGEIRNSMGMQTCPVCRGSTLSGPGEARLAREAVSP
jgi:hypothetical protein